MGDPGLWHLWVDSGGTFTDCLALDPAGELRRAKVLSSGILRVRLDHVAGPGRLVLDPPAGLSVAFLRGFEARPVGAERGRRVVETDAATGVVGLEGPLAGLEAGADVEFWSGEEAPVVAARLVTGTPADRPLPPIAARLASTRGTNALLEGKGSATALFVTRGFGDLLEIGNQQRPDLFALEVEKPPPLHAETVEVDERLAADGSVLAALDLEAVDRAARRLVERGIEAAGVALLHSYRDPSHERAVAGRLRAAGLRHVSLSADLSPRIKILGRARTAVVDAYLSGVLSRYVERVAAGLRPRSFHLLTSAAGLVRADAFRPKDSLLSGPAGGALGAAAAGRASGGDRLLAFDMGGTSTDVSRFDGELEYREETRVGPGQLASTSVAVDTVAAGGGSICSFDGRQLKVGPESAGARPGPACYGAGGPLTLTDVNLLLGRIDPDRFAFAVDVEAARDTALGVARGAMAGPGRPSFEEVLAGFLAIANEKMAAAVRRSSVRKGYAPSDYWLVAFGGAGPQHGCAVAELLGIDTVLVPCDAALLSAVGLGAARIERFAERQVLAPSATVEASLGELLGDLESEARGELEAEGVKGSDAEVRQRRARVRFVGQEATLEVDLPAEPAPGALRDSFRRRYRDLFGYEPGERAVELESVKVLVAGASTAPSRRRRSPVVESASRVLSGEGPLWEDGGWRNTRRFERGLLAGRDPVEGPALILERHSVTVVEKDWRAAIDSADALRLTKGRDAE